MCGRFTLAPPEPTLRELIGPADWRAPYVARWNVAPGQDVLVVTEDGAGRKVEAERWGFPSGTHVLVNARLETAGSSALFRRAFAEGRCIVPADSFYEWRGKGGQPYRVLLRDGRLFGLAAIRSAGGGLAVLTTEACAALAPIHHRMPAILSTDAAWRAWLAGDDPTLTVADDAFRAHPVGRRVNSVLNDDPACAREAPAEATQMSFFP